MVCRWSGQRSGTDSETEEEGGAGGVPNRPDTAPAHHRQNGGGGGGYPGIPSHAPSVQPSPQLTLAEFLQK